MKAARALLLCLALLPSAWAADPPENVFANFHRAAVAGNLDRMLLYSPAARRAQIARMPPAQKAAQAKTIAALLPRTYVIQAKTVDSGGLTMHVSGMSTPPRGRTSEMLYGSIRMQLEGQDWKVGNMNWTNTPPAGAAAGKKPAPIAAAKPTGRYAVNPELGGPPGAQAPKPAAGSAPVKSTTGVRGAGTVMGTTPERKLGTAKPPCVYKPFMTAEDLENCK
jgi:hypothetical protein